MDKKAALTTYFGLRPRLKYARQRICNEVWEAMKAWKKDCFAPDMSKLDGLSDSDFVTEYKADFDKTVQHELGEAVEEIALFAQAHGFDVIKYLQYLERYRILMKEKPVTNILIPGSAKGQTIIVH